MNKEIKKYFEDNEPDPDGLKHKFVQYEYKDYFFKKEWYFNIENKYVLGLTLLKKNSKNEFEEVFHCGNYNQEITDDEIIDNYEKLDKVLKNSNFLDEEDEDDI